MDAIGVFFSVPPRSGQFIAVAEVRVLKFRFGIYDGVAWILKFRFRYSFVQNSIGIFLSCSISYSVKLTKEMLFHQFAASEHLSFVYHKKIWKTSEG
jgi:hypothetical protein